MCNSVLGSQINKSNEKNIIISMSLLMRLFEFMHEDAKDDVSMHKVMEKIIAFTDGTNPLTMDVYDSLISDVDISDESTEDDMDTAYDVGNSIADCDIDMADVRYSDVGKIISAIKNNGYGASNDELEQFWCGYDDCGETQCCSEYDVDMSQYDGKPTTFTLCADDDCYDDCRETDCDIPNETIDEIKKIITISKGF